MDVAVALTTFAVIFPAELPDKTFVATLVLSTRFPPLLVWIGVALAFLVQTLVAVVAGGLLALLPERAVAAGTAVLFAIGSVVLLRGAGRADREAEDEERELAERLDRGGDATGSSTAPTPSAFAAIGTSFGVLFLAEWGDLSQLLTAGLAARSGDPLSVFVGAWLALACVAAIGVVAGRALLRVVRPSTVRRVAGSLFAVLAVLAGLEALGVDLPI
jgi:putative Ca2+/H+ antiporter (TMEM165/GDT1 family)